MNEPHYYAPPLEAVVNGAVPAGTRCRCGRVERDPIHHGGRAPRAPAPAAPAQPERDEQGRWTCSGCGTVAPWGDGWRWLGQLEDRKGNGPIIERVLCATCAPLEQGDQPTLDA